MTEENTNPCAPNQNNNEENERLAKKSAIVVIILTAVVIFLLPPLYGVIDQYSGVMAVAFINALSSAAVFIIITAFLGFGIKILHLIIPKFRNILKKKIFQYLVFPFMFVIASIMIGGLLWEYIKFKIFEIVIYVNSQKTIKDPILQIIFSEIVEVCPYLVYPINYCFLIFGVLYVLYKGLEKFFFYQLEEMSLRRIKQ